MKLQLKLPVKQSTNLVDFIAEHCDVSKAQIKKCLNFGGGWLKKRDGKAAKRVRRAKTELQAGDQVQFYFDDQLLKEEPPKAIVLNQNKEWGLWYKPARLPSQGTLYGDLNCMLEQVKAANKDGKAFLIHRLDTEAAGIMLFAYNKKAAAKLSEVWQNKQVQKHYQVEVLGCPEQSQGDITKKLDKQSALTHYQVIEQLKKTSLLAVEIETGRYHQIRRHMEHIGHPVMGDPRYGEKNKNKEGLRLIASGLKFKCPLTHKKVNAQLPEEYCLFSPKAMEPKQSKPDKEEG